MLPTRMIAIACAASACAVTPRALPDHVREAPLAKPLPIDWAAAGREATGVLAGYLRVDTSNPPGNEAKGAQYLAGILAKEGIESEQLELAPGRTSLIARLKGSGSEKPLCLLSHLDVATAEASRWKSGKGPFSGEIDADGMLWGRGALDMKGLGALETMTLVWLKRQAVPLKRDVVLIAVADEEVDNRGMQQVVDERWKQLDCGHIVNEGGIGIRDLLFEGQHVYAVSVAEKGLLWVRMVATGAAGHGSTPLPGRAPERLLRAIEKINARENEPAIDPSMYTLLGEVGAAKGGVTGFILRRPFLVRRFVLGKLMDNPATRAGITNTCQVTGFAGMLAPNVVPSEVAANVDCRLLPGVKPLEFLEFLKTTVDDPNVRFEVLQSAEANASPWDDPVFEALARHARQGREEIVVGPVLSPGYTDSLLLRPLGVRAYGFVPFEVTKEEAATMHGHDERVSVENVGRGLKILVGAVIEIAGESGH